MRTLLLSISLLLTLQAVNQQPKPTPIPKIKCDPIYRNGDIVGWNCYDLPPECVVDRRKKLPKRPGVEGGQR